MTADALHPELAPEEHQVHDLAGAHVSDGKYVQIAIFLAVATGLEVYLSYSGLEGAALVAPLLVIMAYKFITVALYFMHLKFDPKILTRVFYFGLILAVSVYAAALSTLKLFGG
ncbi:MAG: cytochrome C oxidase subunit IV family protein [Actinobacteria bacterium]|nr:cytochrome C oxidase subunit IV family protein [Actinomycetota bacterium]